MQKVVSRCPLVIAPAVVSAIAGLAVLGTTPAAVADRFTDPTMSLPRGTGLIPGVGPHWPYVQQIQIDTVIPLKNQAIINRTEHGYLFRAGQQDSDLTITRADGRLVFADRGTEEWKWLPRPCRPVKVTKGVAASCRIPSATDFPMLLEVWPRVGDDVVDTSTLSRKFDVAVLGDRGNDVVHLGRGDDFVNGAQDRDRIYGGPGRDWLRSGDGRDFLDGGKGGDHLVGVAGNDTLYGRGGDDRLGGDDGDDTIVSGAGADFVVCGLGWDDAWVGSDDRSVGCEAPHQDSAP